MTSSPVTGNAARRPLPPSGLIPLAAGRWVNVRPSLPQDLDLLRAFFAALSDQDRYFRFMTKLGALSEIMARRFADADQVRHVALLACATTGGGETVVGEARYVLGSDDPGGAEFAVAVATDWQGLGLARALLARLSGQAADAGVRCLTADTLAGNAAMLELARAAGFTVSGNGVDRRLLRLVKELTPTAQRRPWQRFAVPVGAEFQCSQGG
jgi:acetyltransferase